MPQIHQVTQRITELSETHDAGVAVDVDINVHQENYSRLYSSFRADTDRLLSDLTSLKASNPSYNDRITSIEKYIANL